MFFPVMNSVSPTCSFWSNRIFSVPPKHTTRCHRFHNRKTLCHIFCVSSDPAPLNESCPLQASHFYHCFVLCLKDQTHSTDSRRSFLEIDVKGGEREHQSLSFEERERASKLITFLRGREISSPKGGERPSRGRDPQREERDLQGERILK